MIPNVGRVRADVDQCGRAAEMTTEHATLILRRKPQNDRERTIATEALRTLGRAGVPAWEVEADAMRPLDAAERAVLEAAC
jgi:hypothetical protein